MIYLASPYSNQSEVVRHRRYVLAVDAVAKIIRAGHIVYSPIVHSHPLATTHDLPKDWKFWQRQCIGMLDVASEMWILQIDGVDHSIGVEAERQHAMRRRIPVRLVTVDRSTGAFELTILNEKSHAV